MGERERMACLVKRLHRKLRDEAAEKGAETAWRLHMSREAERRDYAEAMRRLAVSWRTEATDKAACRLDWTVSNVLDYFTDKIYSARRREVTAALHLDDPADPLRVDPDYPPSPLRLKTLDVGSCYNPFGGCDFMETLAVDLTPAVLDVLECDFVLVPIGDEQLLADNKVLQLRRTSFDVVIFSLLLEYLPSPQMRTACCANAYELLKPEGILVIITPDSKHVGANAKIYKNWRRVLAKMGLSRVRYEKLAHLHCMLFRKCIHRRVPQQWADSHIESYMSEDINIPQDFTNDHNSATFERIENNPSATADMFEFLPNV